MKRQSDEKPNDTVLVDHLLTILASKREATAAKITRGELLPFIETLVAEHVGMIQRDAALRQRVANALAVLGGL